MLRRLVLDNFRNYSHQEVSFAPGVNAFLGRNGQGKTNLLEAVYYLSLLRSFRTSQLNYLVAAGKGGFTLFGEVEDGAGRVTRLGVANGGERRLLVDGVVVHRASEFISRLVCAAFLPEDLAFIKGAPALRRRFLNIALCQLSLPYMMALQGYNEALKSRNAMLKAPERYPRETVTAWDQVLVQHGSRLEAARQRCVRQLNEALTPLSAEFFPDGRQLTVGFLCGCAHLMGPCGEEEGEVAALYGAALAKSYERDCRDGSTRLGPHRSDLACLLDGRLLTHYGSEGECRTAAIALKLAALELLRAERGAGEITMLVDDVLGELDSVRREVFLAKLAASGQVLFAGTALPPGLPDDLRVFQVTGGRIA